MKRKIFKIVLICLTFALALGFTACVKNTDPPTPPPPDPPEVTVTGVTLSQVNAVLLLDGEPLTLTATVNFSDGTNKTEVTWTSSDKDVVTVREGLLTAKALGTAVITATAVDDTTKAATCTVEVIQQAEILLNTTETVLIMGKGDLKLNAVVKKSSGAVSNNATWTSSDDSVVTVSENGTISPKKVGKGTITATATDGQETLTETCAVNVLADTSTLADTITEGGIIYTLRGKDSNATLGYSIKAVVTPVVNSPLRIGTKYITEEVNLTELIIPNSFKGVRVTEIEENGFRQCKKLNKFSMGRSIVKIGKNAFKLETETELINAGDTSKEIIKTYDRKSEVSRNLRTNITLNEGTEMSEWAFADSFFKIVTISDGLTVIPAYAFSGSTITNINFPTTLTTIQGYAFAGCVSLETADMTNTKLVNIGAAGSDPIAIGNSFLQCGILKTVGQMPATLKTIEHWTFLVCSNLTEITLNEGLEKIGTQAFMHCAKIKEISVPVSVTKVGENAFGRWGTGQTINVPFKQTEKPTGWRAEWQGEGSAAEVIYKV